MISNYDKVIITKKLQTMIVLAKRKYKRTQMAHFPALVTNEKVKKK